jgi:hypothetical protein
MATQTRSRLSKYVEFTAENYDAVARKLDAGVLDAFLQSAPDANSECAIAYAALKIRSDRGYGAPVPDLASTIQIEQMDRLDQYGVEKTRRWTERQRDVIVRAIESCRGKPDRR